MVLNGIRRHKNDRATHQRFICSPGMTGQHSFIVALANPQEAPAVRKRPAKGPATVPAAEPPEALVPAPRSTAVRELVTPRPWTAPEPCPEHPGGEVIRHGVQRTGKDGRNERQRWLCKPPGWYKGATRKNEPEYAKHCFQPVLPREHIHTGAACAHCQQLLTHKSGTQAAGRKHQASLTLVASSLRDLGSGMSYTEVGLYLQDKLRKDGRSPEPRNAWRRAADMLEVFEPALWADWLSQLGSESTAVACQGVPRVVLLDDLPVFSHIGDARSTQRFAVLALGEATHIPGSTRARPVRLRLLRAFPTHSTSAYKLILDELGYVPDFVVADGGKGIKPAVDDLAARAGKPIAFITSAWHIAAQLNRAIAKAKRAQPALQVGDLLARVDNFSLVQSETAWVQWWVEYERRLDAHRVPASGRPVKWRTDYYAQILDQIRAVAPFPDIPRSTGSLEALIGGDIKDTMTRRGGGFGNLIRTNQLTDALALHANRYFSDLDHVAEVLRLDALHGDPDHPGFVPPVRQIVDRGSDRSLLDERRLARIVSDLGL